MLHRPPDAPDAQTPQSVAPDAAQPRPKAKRKSWFDASRPLAVDDDPAWSNSAAKLKRPLRARVRQHTPPEPGPGGG